jgi:hypothetical protein
MVSFELQELIAFVSQLQHPVQIELVREDDDGSVSEDDAQLPR